MESLVSQTAAWSHLPNAPHIDRVLVDLRERTQAWDAARTATGTVAWHAARVAASHAACDAARDAARDAAWGAARGAAKTDEWYAARVAARGAIAALVAWDDAGEYLDFSPEHLRVLSAVGDHRATLILPAALALQAKPIDNKSGFSYTMSEG